MTETRQHQASVTHAEETAEAAIIVAQKAEHKLQAAITKADPRAIQSAQAALVQADQEVADAQNQLQSFNADYGQQLQQTSEQLKQASQDIEANQEKFHTPKQIR